jgi:MFS family permease
VLFLLFLANLLNFYDRTLPAVVAEPMRKEWGLSDFQLGLVTTAFVVVYAIAGLPLGRWADRGSRRTILALGLTVWSVFTGAAALVSGYVGYFLVRMGVGIGEASYAPTANSLIGDLFPPSKRARAISLFMLGLPLGVMLAFFTVGPMVQALGSWRAPFVVAAVPGLLLALFLFRIREPARGAADAMQPDAAPPARPIRTLLAIPTFRWIIGSGLSLNFAAYAINSFIVPLLQRHFGLPIGQAALYAGLITGATGLVGLIMGGWLADRLHQRSEHARLRFSALALVAASLATAAALATGGTSAALFTALFAAGVLAYYSYYACVYPALLDVVAPRLRGTAFAVYFAAMYLLGGAFGPAAVGALSDHLAKTAMVAAGSNAMSESFKAAGLYNAMYLVPVMLGATALCVYLASRRFAADARAMRAGNP